MTTNTTASRHYQLPDGSNYLDEDVLRLIAALNGIDTDMAAVLVSLGGKANTSHTHAISDISGLQSALDGKASSAHTHTFGSLTGVDLTGWATGQFLRLNSSGVVVTVTLDASMIVSGVMDVSHLPSHGHAMSDITGLVAALAALGDAMIFKGQINASTNPNYPAANAGDTYRINTAGKIGGASGIVVEIGDIAICMVDSTAAGNQAAVGANWTIGQTNVDGAVIGPASAVDGTPMVADGTTGKIIKNLSWSLFTAALSAFVGDSGSGGAKGLVPAPAAGDAAAKRFLKADGTWSAWVTPHVTLLASGTSWTSNANSVWAEVTGVGGGAGSGGTPASSASSGGGAGGGAMFKHDFAPTPSTAYAYTIGAAGTAGTSSPSAGGDGGSTTFNDGTTTHVALGGNGGSISTNGGAGGATPQTGNTTNLDGVDGKTGVTSGKSGDGGYPRVNLNNGAIAVGRSTSGVGATPTMYGAGASGSNNSNKAGAVGMQGAIRIVEWY